MQKKPYIGVSGVMCWQEVQSLLSVVPENPPYQLMVGVLASNKTLHGEWKKKQPNRYPTLSCMRGIFIEDPRVLNLVHIHVHLPKNLLDDMVLAERNAGGHGFQINMAWPSLDTLKMYRHCYPHGVIVMQCNKDAYSEVDYDPTRLAERVASYEGYIDYALFDMSAGMGIPIDMKEAQKVLDAFQHLPPSIDIVIAGGLCAEAMPALGELRSARPFSIDAESGLRDADDHLDLGKATAYLRAADRLFKKQAAMV